MFFRDFYCLSDQSDDAKGRLNVAITRIYHDYVELRNSRDLYLPEISRLGTELVEIKPLAFEKSDIKVSLLFY